MIRNPSDYRRDDDQERWQKLRQMSIDDSIVIGEALLTSEIMRLAQFPDDDHPRSLAIALGIAPRPAERRSESR